MIYDAAIIGAGASGLACAVQLVRAGKKIIIFEKESIPGRKILISGNGRCNFTNIAASPDKYFEAADFAKPALQNFTTKNCLDFFASLGMLYRADEGRYFPLTGKASTVVDCLLNALGDSEIKLKTEVIKIAKSGGVFKVYAAGGIVEAKNIVLACGGAAYPQAGGSGKGYVLAKQMGHTITALGPALSPINLKEKAACARLTGLKIQANAILPDCAEEGEVIFSNQGVSGNNILSISRNARPGQKLLLDLMPQFSMEEFEKFMHARTKQLPVKNFLAGILADNLANLLIDFLGIKKTAPANTLNADIFARIIKTIKAWPFTVEALRGDKEYNVTRGGVKLAEIDGRTMQSKLQKGFFLTGEVLDIDGRCGGYNLHFAWASGVLAAKTINEG